LNITTLEEGVICILPCVYKVPLLNHKVGGSPNTTSSNCLEYARRFDWGFFFTIYWTTNWCSHRTEFILSVNMSTSMSIKGWQCFFSFILVCLNSLLVFQLTFLPTVLQKQAQFLKARSSWRWTLLTCGISDMALAEISTGKYKS
jgi:hypothetical protein